MSDYKGKLFDFLDNKKEVMSFYDVTKTAFMPEISKTHTLPNFARVNLAYGELDQHQI